MSGSSFSRHARTRVARTTVVGALAASLTTIGVGAAAGADSTSPPDPAEPVQMETFDPDEFSEPAQRLPADLVDAVRRDLGLSPAEYLAGAATAKRAAEVVDSLGDTVRSAWLQDGSLHVAVHSADDAQAVGATGAQVHTGDALADAVDAAKSQGKLAFADRQAGTVRPVGGDLRGEPVVQPHLIAQSKWRGGHGFAMSDLANDYHCSTGFVGEDADGEPRVLTAGHCGASADGLLSSPVASLDLPASVATSPDLEGKWPQHIGDEVGEFDDESFAFGDGKDAGLVDLSGEDGTAVPEVGSPDTPDEANGLSILGSVDAVAGAPACTSGVTSGWTCGTILASEVTTEVSSEDVTGFLFDACVLPGDSGGPVTVGQYALGVNSGSMWEAPGCASGTDQDETQNNVSLGYALTGGSDDVTKLYGDGWRMLIHVGEPAVTSPTPDSAVDSTPTLSGSVNAAAGATVEVSIGSDVTRETTVTPSGRWTMSVDEPLPSGSHTYEVTVSHTDATGGSATSSTTGTFDVAAAVSLNTTWPQPGDTTTTPHPTFTGTGQPDATVELSAGDDLTADTTVAEDGSWSLEFDEELPAGRFDAELTQQAEGGTDSVTIPDIGLRPGEPVVTSPGAGETVGSHHTFTGIGVPGARVVVDVRVDGNDTAGEQPQLQARANDDGVWKAEHDGPLPADVRSVVATQRVDDLESEPSSEVSFDVAGRDTASSTDTQFDSPRRDVATAERPDLADTGAPTGLLLSVAAGLLVAGLTVVTVLPRRHRAH